MKTLTTITVAVMLSTSTMPLLADYSKDFSVADDPLYIKACSSCHFAYQPGLMPARSWQKMMLNLEEHFGENVVVEKQKALTEYLVKNAADFSNYKRAVKLIRSLPKAQIPLRITEIPYIMRQHDELLPEMVSGNPDVKTLSECDICHSGAELGSYSEDDINIPGYGPWDDDSFSLYLSHFKNDVGKFYNDLFITKVKVKGEIIAIDDHLITIKPANLQLDSDTMQIDIQHAKFKNGNRANLRPNSVIEVKGGWDGNHLYARKVEFDLNAKVKGEIIAINDHLITIKPYKMKGIPLNNDTVQADIQNAEFEDGNHTHLRQHAFLKIKGNWDGEHLYAHEIEFED